MARNFFLLALFLIAFAAVPSARAAEDAKHPPEIDWQFDSLLGTYDPAALQRGFQVYEQVCSACHSMDYLFYRDLSKIGYTEAEIKAIAAKAMIKDGPDDRGEFFERPARPSDRFKTPYENDAQAAFVNNNKVPPDLSLIVKARHGGPDYIYALLSGYKQAPEDVDVPEGAYYNPYFPGAIIAMAPPLVAADQVSYADGTPATIEQMAKDVTHFLTWASAPHMVSRKKTGLAVCLFVLAFAGIMYGVKKKMWSALKPKEG